MGGVIAYSNGHNKRDHGLGVDNFGTSHSIVGKNRRRSNGNNHQGSATMPHYETRPLEGESGASKMKRIEHETTSECHF